MISPRLIVLILDPVPVDDLVSLGDRIALAFACPSSELTFDPALAISHGVRFAVRRIDQPAGKDLSQPTASRFTRFLCLECERPLTAEEQAETMLCEHCDSEVTHG